MRLGIGSWTYGWAVGVSGYPQPARPFTCMGLINRARRFGVGTVQLADNLAVHELPSTAIEQLVMRLPDRE
jgi:hypothetical protein